MTTKQLLNDVQYVQERLKQEINAAEEKAERAKDRLLKAYTRDNARFRPADIIIQRHPEYGPVPFTIIRVISVKTILEGTTPVIVYHGREMHPDFTESFSIHGDARYAEINDRYPWSDSISLLEKPMYTSFVVINAEGKEFPAKTYRESIETAKRELTGTNTASVIRYGINDAGKKEEIQKIFNIRHR